MKFTKMQCLGNDFCIIEDCDFDLSRFAVRILDRYTGVGADGLIVVKRRPLEIRCYNNKGELVNASPNGIRSFARYANIHELVKSDSYDVLTKGGMVNIDVVNRMPFECKINIGKPSFTNKMIYVKDTISCFGRTLNIDDYRVTIYSLYLGDIETVIFVDNLDSDFINIASKISSYSCFSRGTNVNFVHVLDSKNIEVLCYHKDLGFVNCNGSGICASVVAGAKIGLLKNKVTARLKYGSAFVEYGKKEYVYITSTASVVIEGDYKED